MWCAGNLRSKGKLDISGIAVELGGGGHAAAAGFTFHGTVAEAAETVLPKLEALLCLGSSLKAPDKGLGA